MRAAGLTLATVLGLMLAGSASPASVAETIPGKIVPGVGVGDLRLGMSEAAARRVLRPLGASIRYRRRSLQPLPEGYAEYQYPSFENGFGATTYIVGFRNRRVAMIDVRAARNATAAGARVSTLLPKLRALHRAAVCRSVEPGGWLLCILGRQSRAHTVFVVVDEGFLSGRPRVKRVQSIVVRAPRIPLILGR